jgi:hypothetical protein
VPIIIIVVVPVAVVVVVAVPVVLRGQPGGGVRGRGESRTERKNERCKAGYDESAA